MRTNQHFQPTNFEYRESCARQARIEADKAVFFARGKKIEVIPSGVSGYGRDGLGARGRDMKARAAK